MVAEGSLGKLCLHLPSRGRRNIILLLFSGESEEGGKGMVVPNGCTKANLNTIGKRWSTLYTAGTKFLRDDFLPPCYAHYKQVKEFRLRCMLKCKHRKGCKKGLMGTVGLGLIWACFFLINVWLNMSKGGWWYVFFYIPYLGMPVLTYCRYRSCKKKAIRWFNLPA